MLSLLSKQKPQMAHNVIASILLNVPYQVNASRRMWYILRKLWRPEFKIPFWESTMVVQMILRSVLVTTKSLLTMKYTKMTPISVNLYGPNAKKALQQKYFGLY